MQGCVCPHPPLLIPQIGRAQLQEVRATVEAMQRLAGVVGERGTVVVMSPHTPVYRSAFTVKGTARVYGDFAQFGAGGVQQSYETDVDFAQALVRIAAAAGIEVRPIDDPRLDHGVLVPLHFIRAKRLVVLSIVADYGPHRALGAAVRRTCEDLGRPDVLFLASGDLSHRLLPGAPAGYDERGSVFDHRIVELLSEGDFEALADLDDRLVDAAGECGLRSLMALGGFLGDDAARNPQIFSYEGPFGVGYLVAGFNLGADA